jgi:hypothetical protein
MVQSDFKNTIDLIKNINGLQLNFNNQNLSFKQYSKNSKHITFTNQSGMDVNISLEELNNQYKKKYTITNESSVDTSIFNLKNKALLGGNEDIKDSISATSVSLMSKINNNNITNSLTSDSSINNNSLITNSILVGGNNEEISETSASYMSKINNYNITNSLTSDSSLKSNSSKTSMFLVGGNNEDFSVTSLEEASAFETESLSILNSEELLKGGGEEILKGGSNATNNTFTINLEEIRNKLKSNNSNSDTVKYQSSSTLNSLTEFKDMSSQASDTGVLNKLFRQSGGGNTFINNNTKSYNINSSSTSSVCE